MKAVICTKYGPPEVLEIHEVKKPLMKDDQILIKMHATAVTSGDMRLRSAKFPALFWLPMRIFMGFRGPRSKILGIEISGYVEGVGKNVKRFKVGDKVIGSAYGAGFGCYAEYVSQSENAVITTKPDKMTYEEGAALFFGAHTSLHFLRIANIQPGQKVLIYGASGSLGTYAVQLAKYFGAEVTGICSTANIELVRSLGADKVIDYTKEDFTTNGEIYDVIFDTVGKSPFSGCLRSLNKNGYYLRAVHLYFTSIMHGLWTNLTSSKKVIGGVAGESLEDMEFLKGLYEQGKLKPVIDKVYPLVQIREAHAYVEAGHKKGNVVITI